MARWSSAAMILAAAAFAASAQGADSSVLINYQGRITDGAGLPAAGEMRMVFTIHDRSDHPIWEEPQVVRVEEGIFHVLLGSVTALDESLFDQEGLSLGVAVENEELLPRQPVVWVPYAVRARGADRLGGLTPDAFAVRGHDHWGEIWGGPGTGLTLNSDSIGLMGTVGSSGIRLLNAGVLGDAEKDCGVVGLSAAGVGVLGMSLDGCGVAGEGGDREDSFGGHFKGYNGVYAEAAGGREAYCFYGQGGTAYFPDLVRCDGPIDLGPGSHDSLNAAKVTDLTDGGTCTIHDHDDRYVIKHLFEYASATGAGASGVGASIPCLYWREDGSVFFNVALVGELQMLIPVTLPDRVAIDEMKILVLDSTAAGSISVSLRKKGIDLTVVTEIAQAGTTDAEVSGLCRKTVSLAAPETVSNHSYVYYAVVSCHNMSHADLVFHAIRIRYSYP